MKKNKKRVTNINAKSKGRVKVNVSSAAAADHDITPRRFVTSRGIVAGDELLKHIGIDAPTLKRVMAGLRDVLRAGYEARLEDAVDSGIRLFPGVHKDGSAFVVAQAIGKFRQCNYDLDLDITHSGVKMNRKEMVSYLDEAAELNRKAKAETVCVTPDTLVTCPRCGTQFRVGKVLTEKKD